QPGRHPGAAAAADPHRHRSGPGLGPAAADQQPPAASPAARPGAGPRRRPGRQPRDEPGLVCPEPDGRRSRPAGDGPRRRDRQRLDGRHQPAAVRAVRRCAHRPLAARPAGRRAGALMRNLPQRLFNVPLASTPRKAELVMAALADRFGIAHLFNANGETLAIESFGLEDEPAESRPYQVVEGVAIIPVTGTLVQKLGTMRPYSGMTGYDGIRACLSMALEDEAVRAIVLDIESPGGEGAGCFDLVDAVYQVRGEKPIWSVLSEYAYSAAYALASATDRIIVPRTGGTGSVGVICMHVDFSQALSESGINVTLIQYGKRK